MDNVEKYYVSWQEFTRAIDRMAEEYKDRGYACKWVFGIPRGGLPFAVALSHRLGIPFSGVIPSGKKARAGLIVDDIADFGSTLDTYKSCFPGNIFFTMHYHKQSKVVPDFWVYEKTDKWIVYPWEVE